MLAIDKALCSEADGSNPLNKICYCTHADYDNEDKPHCKKHFDKTRKFGKHVVNHAQRKPNFMQKLKRDILKHPEATDDLKFFELGLP